MLLPIFLSCLFIGILVGIVSGDTDGGFLVSFIFFAITFGIAVYFAATGVEEEMNRENQLEDAMIEFMCKEQPELDICQETNR